MDLPGGREIDSNQVANGLIVIAILLIAFGLGLRWEQYMQTNNYAAVFLYSSFMFFAGVHLLKDLYQDR